MYACLLDIVRKKKDGLFYYSEENKVFMSMNAIFLEYHYINNNKPYNKMLLEELESNGIKKPLHVNVDNESH